MPRSRSRRSRRSNGDSRDASRSRSAPRRRSARGRRASTSSSKSSKSCGRRLPRAWRARQQSRSSSAEPQGGLWKRLKRLRPRSVSREAQREVEDEDRDEQQEMEHKLHKQVRANRRQDALQSALRILEGGLHCDPDLLLGMLENAATSPGTEMFAYTLHCTVVAGGLRLSPEEFCKILGIMIFRQALVPQIRAFLNVALPKDAKPVPVIPDGLTDAEADQLFREERVVVEEADEELQSDDEDFGNQAPSAITMQRCRAHPELNGRYVLCLEFSAPGRPVYQKESAKDDLDCELLGDSQEQIYVLYREKPDNAWVISNGLKGRAILTNSREARSPPCLGWQTIEADGSKDDDPGGFMQKQVGITTTRETRFEESSNTVKQEVAGAKGSAPTATDVRAARQALECLDLKQLRGHIACSDPCVAEYFGHFVVLAHLEHLADVSSIKKRRERSSADQLVRWGYALSGLKLLSTFGRREVGNRQGRLLPGWEDTGTEMAAMQLPMTNVDVDRMRIRRGDSVTISTTDPLQDKLAEGTISDIRPGGTLIVQLRGIFPEDCRETLWRVDKSANATVYERQMWALLGLNHAVRVQPTIELMTAAPVGMADRWAMRWQERPKVEDKKPRRRSPSKGRKKRKKRSASSASKASESSSELEKIRRRKRCSQLAQCELVDDHREEKLLQAQREVDEVENLNPSQRSALNAALTQTCTVVQGPPGTGKTSVSVQILHFWTKIMNLTPVLATSDSNVAVDNICEGLRARGVKAIRVGRPEKVRSVIEDMTLEAELKRFKEQQQPEESKDGDKEKDDDQEFKQGAGKGGKMGGKFGKFGKGKGDGDDGDRHARHFEDRRAQSRQDFELQMKILREAEVICTTTIAAGMDFLARLANFEAILVDEVAQATELSTAVPVILRGANRLVLVGDHCQLPPAVLSPEAELRGLSVSVYSRLVQAGGLKPFMLDTQYRSHPKLAEFSSKAFYDGMLKSGIEAGQRVLPSGVPWPNSDCPIAFINVDAQEELEGDSKANSVEAQMVASLVGKVFQHGELNVSQVGVVTPYVAQVRRLRQMLRPVIPPGSDFRLLECASVDNFQGREKELIVFSAVRSNRAGNVGFLADWRRLNVMLTRARRGLLIFGNAATLKQDPTWKKWLTFAEEHDCVVKDLPMPQIPYGKGPMSGMWPGPPGGKGKVMKGLPPRPVSGRNPMLAAAQAARAAAEVSADLQQRAEDAQSPWEADPSVMPAPRPWLRERPAFPQLGAAPQPDPQMQMQRQLDEQLQQLTHLESQLNHQQQQLHQKRLQAAQLLFVNPILAQVQMQQIQQENNQLQHRWTEFEAQKARLQEQRRRVPAIPASNSNGVAPSNIFAEHMQIEKLLERQLGL